MVMMMDEDYGIGLEDDAEIEDVESVSSEGSFSDIYYSAAAFAPHHSAHEEYVESLGHIGEESFDQRLGDLLDELNL